MDPLQVHKNGKIFLLLDTEIGAVGHIASMGILPAGALFFSTGSIKSFTTLMMGLKKLQIVGKLSCLVLFDNFSSKVCFLDVVKVESKIIVRD